MAKGPLTIGVRKTSNAVVLDLQGRVITGEAVEALRAKIRELQEGGASNLAINLAGVTYVDSSGIGLIVASYMSARKAGGNLKPFAAPERLLPILKLAQLHTLFDLQADESSALSSF